MSGFSFANELQSLVSGYSSQNRRNCLRCGRTEIRLQVQARHDLRSVEAGLGCNFCGLVDVSISISEKNLFLSSHHPDAPAFARSVFKALVSRFNQRRDSLDRDVDRYSNLVYWPPEPNEVRSPVPGDAVFQHNKEVAKVAVTLSEAGEGRWLVAFRPCCSISRRQAVVKLEAVPLGVYDQFNWVIA